MIEYNFNELDNDFITCWCKYLLTGDSKLIMRDLEKLAELGQINAMQQWYRFNKVGANAIIDKKLNSLGDTYNELYVKARVAAKDISQIERHKYLSEFADEEEYVSGFRSGYYQLTKKAEQARKDICEIEYVNLYYSAVNRSYQIGERTDDILVLQTCSEIYSELSGLIGIKDYAKCMNKDIKKMNAEICSAILKEMKQEKKNTPNYNPLNNPRSCFAFLKTVLLYTDSHKQKPLAIKFLKELANREYSDKLKIAKSNPRV